MKSFRFLYFLLIVILFSVFSILSACSAYPSCQKSNHCFLIGENLKIKIPVILPITSSNINLAGELQKVVELAYKENIWISENTELFLVDNFDDPQKNSDSINSYLESSDTPLIVNFLTLENNREHNLPSNKNGKILVSKRNIQIDEIVINSVLPNEDTLKKQAIDLIANFAYTKKLVVLSDINTIQNDLSNLCNQNFVNCYQFASTSADLIEEIGRQKTIPVALISQTSIIEEWLAENYYLVDNPILIFDTSFSNPEDFLTLYNNISWIGPDIWSITNPDSNSFSETSVEWGYLETTLAYRQLTNIFEALEIQLSNSRNGFRQLDPTIFIDQYKQISTLQEIKVHFYQLKGSQFIMVNEPASN